MAEDAIAGSEEGAAVVALDGRAVGRRGAATRRRILDATASVLERGGLRDLRVADIARRAGCSPATFYQYFRDVPSAVLVLAEEAGEGAEPLAALLESDWSAPSGPASARALVDGFLDYWDAHRAVLRTRNLAAQEGDARFRDVRNQSLRPLTEGLARMLVGPDGSPRTDGVTPYAAAAALVAMLERMAAFHGDLEAYGLQRHEVVETTAHILHATVTN
ncbi:MAG: TetR family transcriptional regulator [Actinomycetes bacterium]